jgi:ABC-type lipoprotein export system ATPase subunit
MLREYVQNKVAQAWQTAGIANLLICVEPISSLQNGDNQRLLALLRKVQSRPDQSLVVVTGDAVFFGFAPPEKTTAAASASTDAHVPQEQWAPAV